MAKKLNAAENRRMEKCHTRQSRERTIELQEREAMQYCERRYYALIDLFRPARCNYWKGN